MPEDQKTYYPELSSIRGIASVVVLFGHSFDIIQRLPAGNSPAARNPLGAAFEFFAASFNGNAAVELFFVLSGLVLSLSLNRREGPWPAWTTSFYVRRMFRIYPALWVSLVIATFLLPFEQLACRSGLCTPWAAAAYHQHYTLSQIVLSFCSLYVHLNGPMWSLRVELFYSLLFPLIFLLLRNGRTKWPSMAVFFLLAAAPFPRVLSVHYVLAFALGSLIPLLPIRHRTLPYRGIVFAAGGVLLFAPQLLVGFQLTDKTLEIVEMLASFAVIYAIFHRLVDLTMLCHRSLFYVGEISYSIYVLHFPLLFSLFYAEQQIFSAAAIRSSPYLFTLLLGVSTLAATLALAAVTYRFVEVPFQHLGRLASRAAVTRICR